MDTAEEGKLGGVPGRRAVGEAPASTACAAGPLAARGTGVVAEAPAWGTMLQCGDSHRASAEMPLQYCHVTLETY